MRGTGSSMVVVPRDTVIADCTAFAFAFAVAVAGSEGNCHGFACAYLEMVVVALEQVARDTSTMAFAGEVALRTAAIRWPSDATAMAVAVVSFDTSCIDVAAWTEVRLVEVVPLGRPAVGVSRTEDRVAGVVGLETIAVACAGDRVVMVAVGDLA